jgi:16S rRNA C967 or C1407 C5-methylase (RsmB/RsmF family)/NOL1/NOP2/fmu family ribosome biogenesis protein
MNLPISFVNQMRAQLGDEFSAFEQAVLHETPPVSVRLNPFKNSGSDLLISEMRDAASNFPNSKFEIFLKNRPVFTLDPLHHAGAYYVQEASSMFLEMALRQTIDFHNSLKIIDLCAAPGGKTTLMASLLNAESFLVANEVIRTRVSVLQENLERWGCPNVAVTCADSADFAPLEGWFDVVVVDAPCSGEGLFRKDENARGEWSPEAVQLCSARQKRILENAQKLVAPSGILIYSTCTYNHFENGDNAFWLTQNTDFQAVTLNIDEKSGIKKVDFGAGDAYQFYPHRVRGEGFFMAVFRKNADQNSARPPHSTVFQKIKPIKKNLISEANRWLNLEKFGEFSFFETPTGEVLALPKIHESNFLIIDKTLKQKWFGIQMGQFKGNDLIPDHALALSNAISEDIPRHDFTRDEALHFLKKENPVLPDAPTGWTLACFENLPIGWMKILPNRVNNYLPLNRRIRMNL